MTDRDHGYNDTFHLDAVPEKVWRAISVDALREVWLPDQKIIEVVRSVPMQEIEMIVEERDPPFERSHVRFGLSSDAVSGTVLSISHRPAAMLGPTANDNAPPMMLAA